MKQIINLPGPSCKLIDSPIPAINDDQVLIRVVVSGSNPKDWKMPELVSSDDSMFGERYAHLKDGVNQGDDIAGVVEKVGRNVYEFKPGDRVGAFHEMMEPGGSYAEYAVAWAHTTFHLPEKVSFEEAATIPLAALTAVVSLYHHHRLPLPWTPPPPPTAADAPSSKQHRIPLLIYGGSTAVGAFAIKLARASNIHPIIAVAGAGAGYISRFLDASKGDAIVDYREGATATIQGVKDALARRPAAAAAAAAADPPLMHVLDTIVTETSSEVIRNVIHPGGQVNYVLPCPYDISPGVKTNTWVSSAHQIGGDEDARDLCFVFCRWFGRALATGAFEGHPFQVREKGLLGVEGAMRDLKDNKASAVKYVFRVGETPGL
ncbi:zinc-binding alcohol dehydrogenase family protein [Aspergillus saccharolyticus JOP 1030-1]|uniref:Quinone oxidoreductase n=1 Tax=Aspergillus saccharolyticus JOP 1030-1 TaxID=1450539 RepID=A0A318ZP16_9EURO|nr:quinone oxidoreductase [Aspergillus saccharolyticus JOP 1030-1]PYH48717.1 quinone oxidoreductase [Aspergillus saccharolyticus JOP 1030-1]